MFKRKTVFVVGAGASYELGLPLGSQLRVDIEKLLDIRFDGSNDFNQISGDSVIGHELFSLMQNQGLPDLNGIIQKCWLIRDAIPGAISIDNFLDAHRHDEVLVKIGKMAIARAILMAEKNSKIYIDPNGDHPFRMQDAAETWLMPFFNLLNEGIGRSNVEGIFENIKIISFNYDRTIEHFLRKALEIYYGISNNVVADVMKSLEIVHPYGVVGGLIGENHVEFGSDYCDFGLVSDNIKTFSEGIYSDSLRYIINSIMTEAEQVIFIGFAFHPMNMEILSVPLYSNIKKVFATTKGLSRPSVDLAKQAICDCLKTVLPRIVEYKDEIYDGLSEVNLENLGAAKILEWHFRGISA